MKLIKTKKLKLKPILDQKKNKLNNIFGFRISNKNKKSEQ